MKDSSPLSNFATVKAGIKPYEKGKGTPPQTQEIVNNKELESYFSHGNEILNEQAIIQKEGKTIKPDRMVLTKNKEVYLLDYKTGTHNQKYQLQLENYQNAIEKMGLKVTKKALVYIGEEINVVNL